jgi:hypothetical protein
MGQVQGEYDKNLARRLFDYNLAAWQLYGKTVVSLAVLCDDRPKWRPDTFHYSQWGCKMELSFLTAKLLDYAGDVATLEASDNPFAAVVLAHLHGTSRETKGQPRRPPCSNSAHSPLTPLSSRPASPAIPTRPCAWWRGGMARPSPLPRPCSTSS